MSSALYAVGTTHLGSSFVTIKSAGHSADKTRGDPDSIERSDRDVGNGSHV